VAGSSGTEGRARALRTPGALLFAYGTLQFPDVLTALIDRVPQTHAAAATGWRAAALAGRSYPGLVAARSTATGLVLAGLSDAEIQLIDDFESGPYNLRQLTLADGRTAWAYVWTDGASVLPDDWSRRHFANVRLTAFVSQCRSWRASYEAADRITADLHRPQDS
jgi:gamma-glutamylcyclotransferase (GGCT)/AIG2-like uncharacterized protein YtfP